MYRRPLGDDEYLVPVTYEMMGYVAVKASSPEEAFEKVCDDDGTCPLPQDPVYVDGSFGTSYDTPETVQTVTDDYKANRLNIELSSDSWNGPERFNKKED